MFGLGTIETDRKGEVFFRQTTLRVSSKEEAMAVMENYYCLKGLVEIGNFPMKWQPDFIFEGSRRSHKKGFPGEFVETKHRMGCVDLDREVCDHPSVEEN